MSKFDHKLKVGTLPKNNNPVITFCTDLIWICLDHRCITPYTQSFEFALAWWNLTYAFEQRGIVSICTEHELHFGMINYEFNNISAKWIIDWDADSREVTASLQNNTTIRHPVQGNKLEYSPPHQFEQKSSATAYFHCLTPFRCIWTINTNWRSFLTTLACKHFCKALHYVRNLPKQTSTSSQSTQMLAYQITTYELQLWVLSLFLHHFHGSYPFSIPAHIYDYSLQLFNSLETKTEPEKVYQPEFNTVILQHPTCKSARHKALLLQLRGEWVCAHDKVS